MITLKVKISSTNPSSADSFGKWSTYNLQITSYIGNDFEDSCMFEIIHWYIALYFKDFISYTCLINQNEYKEWIFSKNDITFHKILNHDSFMKNNEAYKNQILTENSKKNNFALNFCCKISCYKIST